MNDYLRTAQEFYKSYSNYVDKYLTRTSKDKNHGIMIEVAGECYEMFQEVLQKEGSNEFLEKSCELFLKFQDLVMEYKPEEIKALHMEFGEFLTEEQNKNLHRSLISGIFMIDVEQMKLQHEKMGKCQELVDLDKKLYGEVTNTTKEILESQHMELYDGQVKEKIYEFADRNKANIETQIDNRNEIKPEEAGRITKKQYQATAYLKKTTDKPIVLYGNNAQELLEKFQKWNEARPDDMKYYTCYIRSLNPETNRYENSVKYEVASGKNISPIYLEIPSMKRETFLEVVAQLKADGAKYSPSKKTFYITAEQEVGKFSQYLPKHGKLPHTASSKEKMDKPSVRKQLEENKDKIKETGQEKKSKQQEIALG